MLGLLLMLLPQVEPTTKPPPAAKVTPRTKALLARLAGLIVMEFPKAVPLDDVLQHIKWATQKWPNDPGIPIYIDPMGLPRRCVVEDGRLVIHSRKGIQKLITPASSRKAGMTVPDPERNGPIAAIGEPVLPFTDGIPPTRCSTGDRVDRTPRSLSSSPRHGHRG